MPRTPRRLVSSTAALLAALLPLNACAAYLPAPSAVVKPAEVVRTQFAPPRRVVFTPSDGSAPFAIDDVASMTGEVTAVTADSVSLRVEHASSGSGVGIRGVVGATVRLDRGEADFRRQTAALPDERALNARSRVVMISVVALALFLVVGFTVSGPST